MRYRIALVLALTTILFVAFCSPADAKKRPHHRPMGFTCGAFMHSLFPHLSSKINWNYARNYALLPRTSAHAGAIVVSSRKGKASDGKSPGGHVVKLLSDPVKCVAKVQDNRGVRMRNICNNQIAVVDPSGEPSKRTSAATHPPRSKNNSRTGFSEAPRGILIRVEHF